MNNKISEKLAKRGVVWMALGALTAWSFAIGSAAAFAQASVTLPIQSIYAASAINYGDDNVFSWRQVPQDQQVPIRRACFDRDGYQLYDAVGETIVVPFTNDNLYVMKFAVSPDSHMYFINEGSIPVLYLPRHGCLYNSAVPGARWYPFSERFHPRTAVYVGIAPSWSDFIGMGWYPNMACNGGYWCDRPRYSGGVFIAEIGLVFLIGGHDYDGWGAYHSYYAHHHARYRTSVFNENIYRMAARPYSGHRQFVGTSRSVRAHGGAIAGRPSFQGTSKSLAARRGLRTAGVKGNARTMQARSTASRQHAVRAAGVNGNAGRFQGTRPMATRQHAVRAAGVNGNAGRFQGIRSTATRQQQPFQGGGRSFNAHRAMPSGRSFQNTQPSHNAFAGGRSQPMRPQSSFGGNHPQRAQPSFGGGQSHNGGNAGHGSGGAPHNNGGSGSGRGHDKQNQNQ